MIKTRISVTIILISVFGIIFSSGGIAISNIQATYDDVGDDTQSSIDSTRSSDNSTTQTFGDELPPSDNNNEAQTSDNDSNELISTNQELLPGLEQSNSQVLQFEETQLPTSNTSTNDIQNPDTKSDVNQKAATSSQNNLRSNYLAEMPLLSDVKDCYKSDCKISLDGQ